MDISELTRLLEELVKQPKESEWVEFKESFHSPEEIGKQISALANGASINNQQFGYLVFGVQDSPQTVVGTHFKFSKKKKGNEELENWVMTRLNPRIDFKYYEFTYQGREVVLLEIPPADGQPVRFSNIAYIRIGSYSRKLIDFPEKEKKLWDKKLVKAFEKGIALRHIEEADIVSLLDTQGYFELINLPYPSSRKSVIDRMVKEKFVVKQTAGYSITNLGAILFAKDIGRFATLARKAVRVIVYNGKNRINTEREQIGTKGYAVGYEGLVNWINDQLPANEEIGKIFRKEVRLYPEIGIRELVANAIIHQDFSETGTGPMIEIFSDRIEFTSPGLPLITVARFIDEFQSRNESLAAFLRRIGICEEKGSGIDKVVFNAELYQLPAPDFQIKEKHTKVILYSYKDLGDMDKKDKIRACYQHACLRYVSNEKMTNQSLRERFNIQEHNAAIASRIIKDTLTTELIKEDDPESKSRKYAKYIPFWA